MLKRFFAILLGAIVSISSVASDENAGELPASIHKKLQSFLVKVTC